MSTSTSEPGAIAGLPLGAEVRTDGDATGLSVAIVGGGIVGIALALGLVERGVRVSVYERAQELPEIGVGFAFNGAARKSMARLSPLVIAALERVANENEQAYDNYWDGYTSTAEDDESSTASKRGKLLFRMPNSNMAWWSCLRSQFLNEMLQALPPGTVTFGKELDSYNDPFDTSDPVRLRFTDGTTAAANVLIGSDGLRSRVRQQLFATSHPEVCNPTYTHKTCYRAVIPMAAAESAMGLSKPHNHCMHTGPRAHVLSYPIAQHKLVNVVLFVTHDEPWVDGTGDEAISVPRMTRPGDKKVLQNRLADWRPEVRNLVAQLPDAPTAWGIFDTAEHPVPFYAAGRVGLVGDAAHASSPHHGAGAGFGVEDALALAVALGMATEKKQSVAAALQAFNDVRYDRTQWLIRSSKETGDIYEWKHFGVGGDPVKIRAELEGRQKTIWDYDVDAMAEEVKTRYEARVTSETTAHQ
ncbi:Sat7 [Stachybotrys chartarum IBT 40293]|nr:Sat7 [Stachybotrys chartarum IBT 40293]